ncbi:putative E3 ubiquitin-protein ligase SINA-like 6 [Lycium barbarum]|uniref:putative E3 ubiquitin-protein ligase SINA-like 6 n=1 Tax=Lycium barbarum TaxID=112863 RepID=UPI00293F5B2D|nr:putative E3 ubiquitin-protein ligase SINA-like 6 [Lycium barbarum]
MARFSLGREEDEGPSSPSRRRPLPKKRRTLNGTFSCCSNNNAVNNEQQQERRFETIIEEEEEEELDSDSVTSSEEEPDHDDFGSGSAVLTEDPVGEGLRGNGSVSVILSDPDVLDCPICLESLCIPVFQCENGHIACASCCIKIANKCPSCCWPIGYNRCRAIEKVLESVKVSCTNKRYGCKEILTYSKKTDHENTCIYVPCSCPFRGCDFVGSSAKVYAHFSDKHGSSAERIFFNAVNPIYIEKNQRYQILQMRTEGIIFIVNHSSDRLGSAVNMICVGPASQKRRFLYELVATDGESSFKLESVAESIPNWSENCALKKFLFVPKEVVNSSARLKLDVFIEERECLQ